MPDGAKALVVTVAGTAGLIALAGAAWQSAAAAGLLVAVTILLAGAAVLALGVTGYREDGLLGVLYRMRHPMGTILGGDDRPPWTWYAIAWVLLLACVLSGLVIARHPGAFPIGRSPAGQPTSPGP